MMWQDIVISILEGVMLLCMLPLVRDNLRSGGEQQNKLMSGITALSLTGVSIMMYTVGLPKSAMVLGASAVMWYIIFLSAFKQKIHEKLYYIWFWWIETRTNSHKKTFTQSK